MYMFGDLFFSDRLTFRLDEKILGWYLRIIKYALDTRGHICHDEASLLLYLAYFVNGDVDDPCLDITL